MANYSGFFLTESEQGVDSEGKRGVCCGSVTASSFLCRTNADEAAVTVTRWAGPDTIASGGTGLIPSEAIRAKTVGTCHTLMTHL